MTMVIVKMPGGDIEYVDSAELLWMRDAFDHEFKNAVMLRIGSQRIYSVEPLNSLQSKFQEAGAAIARFTPPEGNIAMLVNADKVREVEPPNPVIFHENARSILKFGSQLRLAVRETEEEAHSILAASKTPLEVSSSVAAVVGGAVAGAVIGAAAVATSAALSTGPQTEDED